MRKSRRATFKLAVRYHKNNMAQLKADACAEVVLDQDSNNFRKSVIESANEKRLLI